MYAFYVFVKSYLNSDISKIDILLLTSIRKIDILKLSTERKTRI